MSELIIDNNKGRNTNIKQEWSVEHMRMFNKILIAYLQLMERTNPQKRGNMDLIDAIAHHIDIYPETVPSDVRMEAIRCINSINPHKWSKRALKRD